MNHCQLLLVFALLLGCVPSTLDGSGDARVATDAARLADSAILDISADRTGPVQAFDAGGITDVDPKGSSDGGVDFFTTPGCRLDHGNCVAWQEGVLCQNLLGGRLRSADQCLVYGTIGCMQNVRGTSPAATCMDRLEADGTTARCVVFSRYDYEVLAQAERYSVVDGQCGSALGWPMCPSR